MYVCIYIYIYIYILSLSLSSECLDVTGRLVRTLAGFGPNSEQAPKKYIYIYMYIYIYVYTCVHLNTNIHAWKVQTNHILFNIQSVPTVVSPETFEAETHADRPQSSAVVPYGQSTH